MVSWLRISRNTLTSSPQLSFSLSLNLPLLFDHVVLDSDRRLKFEHSLARDHRSAIPPGQIEPLIKVTLALFNCARMVRGRTSVKGRCRLWTMRKLFSR